MFRIQPILLFVCFTVGAQLGTAQDSSEKDEHKEAGKRSFQIGGANKEQEAEIRSLIEQLVFADQVADDKPVRNPLMKIFDADGNEVKPAGDPDDEEAKRKRFTRCQEAFGKLYQLKGLAIPILVEHLEDDRQSINFRNHHMGNSVGHACYWNIYFQLLDQPRDYSEYGYSREGRDGEQHPKPYWEGTPFDEAGGPKKWLAQHKDLNYKEMQIKCLQWLLDAEKKIGASDPPSYFLNILPLEIRILERRLENGEDVSAKLTRLKRVRDKKLADQIPKELLPGG